MSIKYFLQVRAIFSPKKTDSKYDCFIWKNFNDIKHTEACIQFCFEEITEISSLHVALFKLHHV